MTSRIRTLGAAFATMTILLTAVTVAATSAHATTAFLCPPVC